MLENCWMPWFGSVNVKLCSVCGLTKIAGIHCITDIYMLTYCFPLLSENCLRHPLFFLLPNQTQNTSLPTMRRSETRHLIPVNSSVNRSDGEQLPPLIRQPPSFGGEVRSFITVSPKRTFFLLFPVRRCSSMRNRLNKYYRPSRYTSKPPPVDTTVRQNYSGTINNHFFIFFL